MVKRAAQRLVSAPSFEYVIIALIVGNGALLGVETSPELVRQYGEWMHLGNQVVLAVFILEAMVKMMGPWRRTWIGIFGTGGTSLIFW